MDPSGWNDVAHAWTEVWGYSLFSWLTAGNDLKKILLVTWAAGLHSSWSEKNRRVTGKYCECIDNMNAFWLHVLTGTHWMMFVSFKFELVGQHSSDSWIIIQFKTDEMWGSRSRFEEFFIFSILFSTLVIAPTNWLITQFGCLNFFIDPIPCSRVSEGFLLVLWFETATFPRLSVSPSSLCSF